MNHTIPTDTPIILNKNSSWHQSNPGPHNPTDCIGLMAYDSGGDIEVYWNAAYYGVFYRNDDTDLIPLFGKFSREQMRAFARVNQDLVVADNGADSWCRWQLATREI